MNESPSGSQTIAGRLVKASAIYGISNAFAKALLFVLLPAFTYFLTPADYGIIALAETIAIFVGYTAAFGLPGTLSRKFFDMDPADLEARRETVSTIVQAGVGLAFLVVILVEFVGPWFFASSMQWLDLPFRPYVALAVGTAVAIEISRFRHVLYQAEERPIPYAYVSVAEAVIAAALVTVFVVFLEMGALGWLLGRFIASSSMSLVNIVLLRGWIPGPFSTSTLKAALAFGLPLVPHQMGAHLLAGADRFFLEYFRDMETVGVYSLAYGLGTVLSLVTMTIVPAWFPHFYKTASREDSSKSLGALTLQIIAVLGAFAVVGIVIGEPFVRYLLDSSYVAASQLVALIIFATFLHGIYVFFQFGILQSGRTSALVFLTALALGLNLILNLLFVPDLGAVGAAYATIISHGAYVLGTYYFAQRLYHVSYPLPRLLLIVALIALLTVLSQLDVDPTFRMPLVAVCGLASMALLWKVGAIRADTQVIATGDLFEEE